MASLPTIAELELVPIIAIIVTIGLPLMIPIIAMLLKHQRNMAEFVASNNAIDANVQTEIRALREELRELKSTLFDHSMSLDQGVQNITRRLETVERSSDEQRLTQ